MIHGMQDKYHEISTHTPLAGRDQNKPEYIPVIEISTHTPLAGRDVEKWCNGKWFYISTHTPLAGRDRRS